MRNRCYYRAANNYARYGGRGITVCEEWRASFKAFLRDMGQRPQGMTLDRIDNNGPYSPENCRWVSKRDQRMNRRDVELVEFEGVALCKRDWDRKLGLRLGTMSERLFHGWTVEEFITEYRRK